MKDNEKLMLQSHDWVADNQHAFTEFVKERFPNCITEGRVDMDLLRQEVSSEIVEGPNVLKMLFFKYMSLSQRKIFPSHEQKNRSLQSTSSRLTSGPT